MMPDIPTYEPVYQNDFNKVEIERIMETPPRLKSWVRKAVLFIGGFIIGFVAVEIVQRVLHLW
jgi:hypothetical protein